MNSIAWEQLSRLDEVVIETRLKYEELKHLQSLIDKECTDIEHIIEFGVFNVVDGYKLTKRLQEVLKQRRQIKDESIILNNVMGCFSEKLIETSKNKVIGWEKGLDKRKYAYRVMTDEHDHELIKLAKLMN